MRAPLYAAMSDATFLGAWLVVALAVWAALILVVAVPLGRAAAKPAPWEDAYFAGDELPITGAGWVVWMAAYDEQLEAAQAVVAEAEAIVKAAAS